MFATVGNYDEESQRSSQIGRLCEYTTDCSTVSRVAVRYDLHKMDFGRGGGKLEVMRSTTRHLLLYAASRIRNAVLPYDDLPPTVGCACEADTLAAVELMRVCLFKIF